MQENLKFRPRASAALAVVLGAGALLGAWRAGFSSGVASGEDSVRKSTAQGVVMVMTWKAKGQEIPGLLVQRTTSKACLEMKRSFSVSTEDGSAWAKIGCHAPTGPLDADLPEDPELDSIHAETLSRAGRS